MKQPQGFVDLLSGLHQDPLTGITSLEDLASTALLAVRSADRPVLRTYLAALCAEMTAAEIKGVLNRGKTDLVFDTKSASTFLKAVLDQLSPRL